MRATTSRSHDPRSPGSAARPILATVILCSLAAWSSAPAGDRELTRDIPAAGVESVRLVGGDGSVRVTAVDTDSIHIGVTLSPKRDVGEDTWRWIKSWFLSSKYDSAEELLSAVAFDIEDGPGTVSVGLTPRGRTRTTRLEEAWVLEVPRRTHLVVRMDASDVDVRDMGGGLEMHVGVGDVRAIVPGGDVTIRLSVGDVELVTESDSVGDLRLDSQVGKTRLWMNGSRIRYEDPPGAGSRIRTSGNGRDTISIAVQVGNVTARVNEDPDDSE